MFFMHYFIASLGATYSWSTPVTDGGAGGSGGAITTPFTGASASGGGGGDERPKATDGDATGDAAINFSTYQSGGAVSYQS